MTDRELDGLLKATRLELWRRTDEALLLRELLSEVTGLSLTGVAHLLALHRRASGVQDMGFAADDVLAALGRRWWRTGVIARALLVNGGKGLTARQRSDHHHHVGELLEGLWLAGRLERRRIGDDGRELTLDRSEGSRGYTEWRRVAA